MLGRVREEASHKQDFPVTDHGNAGKHARPAHQAATKKVESAA